MSKRNERIDQSVEYTRKLLAKFPYERKDDILARAGKYMIKAFRLSESSRRDYLKTVSTLLENEFAAQNARIEELEEQKLVAKLEKIGYDVLRRLAGPDYSDFSETDVLNALAETGKFNKDQSHAFFEKMKYNGQIYETRPGYWSRA